MKLENARYSKIALTLKLTLSVPVNTVSFSTVFFFFPHLTFIFQVSFLFRFIVYIFTFGDTSAYDW